MSFRYLHTLETWAPPQTRRDRALVHPVPMDSKRYCARMSIATSISMRTTT